MDREELRINLIKERSKLVLKDDLESILRKNRINLLLRIFWPEKYQRKKYQRTKSYVSNERMIAYYKSNIKELKEKIKLSIFNSL